MTEFADISRWPGPYRAKVDQRRRYFRFMLESALVPSRYLQVEWLRVHGENVNVVQDAQQVGHQPRAWIDHGGYDPMGTRYRWGHLDRPRVLQSRGTTRGRAYPHPGVGLSDIGSVLGITRERVRQHAERADFPAPTPSTIALRHRKWFRADIERYYRECAEVNAAYRAAGLLNGHGQITKVKSGNPHRRNGRIKFIYEISDPERPGKRREFRIDIPNDATLDDLEKLNAEIAARIEAIHRVPAPR